MKYKQVKKVMCALTATVMLSASPLRITAETAVSNVPAAGVSVTLEEGNSLEEVVQNVVESSPAQETANESESSAPVTSDDVLSGLSSVGESAIDEKVDAPVSQVSNVMSGVGVSQVLEESKAPVSPLTAGAGEMLATAYSVDKDTESVNVSDQAAGQPVEAGKTEETSEQSDQSTGTLKTEEKPEAESESSKESQSSDANTSTNNTVDNNAPSNSETDAAESSSEAPSESTSESVSQTPSTETPATEESKTEGTSTEQPSEPGSEPATETPAETESTTPAETQTESASSEHTTAETTASTAAAETVDKGDHVADFAVQFVGNPYVYGGTSLTNGADCSGFVMSVYKNFGVSLPHSSTADRNVGSPVSSLEEAQPGDLVCYSGHVAIYIGDGKIVHASTEETGIKISDADYKSPVAIRRIYE